MHNIHPNVGLAVIALLIIALILAASGFQIRPLSLEYGKGAGQELTAAAAASGTGLRLGWEPGPGIIIGW